MPEASAPQASNSTINSYGAFPAQSASAAPAAAPVTKDVYGSFTFRNASLAADNEYAESQMFHKK